MAAAETPHEEGPTLDCLDDNMLEAVFHAVRQAPKALPGLASTCRRFNGLARQRVPVKLRVRSAHTARQLLYSRWQPFSACRSLHIGIESVMELNLAEEMLVRFGDSWSKVEEVEVVVLQEAPPEPVPEESMEVPSQEAATTGLLGCLQGLKQLASLRLLSPKLGASSMHALCKLTTLRSLAFHSGEYTGGLDDLADMTALQCLTHLAVSAGGHMSATPAAVEDAGGFLLPSTLQELQIDSRVMAPTWWGHLAGCPDLQVLSISYGPVDQWAECHPREVVAVAAQHCNQLTRLELKGGARWYNEEEGHHWDPWHPWEAEEAEEAEQHQEPWHPCEGLAGLPNLQHLNCTGACRLELGSADDWGVLGGLTQLTSLHGWRAMAAPPAGLQLPAVVQLKGTCEDANGRVLSGLLQACPQLQTMEVRVLLRLQDLAGQPPPVPEWLEQELLQLELQQEEQQPPAQGWLEPEQQEEEEQQQQQPPDQQQVSLAGLSLQQQQEEEQEAQVQLPGEAQPHAANAREPADQVAGAVEGLPAGYEAIIHYHHEEGVPDTSVAAHFAATAPSLAGVRELILVWPLYEGHLEVLPDLSPLTQLEILRLQGNWHQQGFGDPEEVQVEEQVVSMLLPVRNTLQKLELAHVRGLGPRVALLLQDSFPVLTCFDLIRHDLDAPDMPNEPPYMHSHWMNGGQELQEVVAALRLGLQVFMGGALYSDRQAAAEHASMRDGWPPLPR